MQYRQQQIQERQNSIDNQMAEHQLKVMSDSADRWDKIYGADPKIQPILIKRQVARDNMLGFNSQGFADLANDPNNRIDVVQPVKELLDHLQDPNNPNKNQAVAQAWNAMRTSGGDALSLKDLISSSNQALQSYRANQIQGQKVGIQQQGQQMAQQKMDTAAQNKSGDVLTGYQKSLNTSEYQKASSIAANANMALGEIENARNGNQVTANAVPVLLATVTTGGQRINQAEIQRLGGGKALTTRVGAALEQMKSGDLTDENAAYMKDFVNVMQKGAQAHMFDLENNQAMKMAQRTGQDVPTAYKQLTGKEFPNNPQDLQSTHASNQGLQTLDPDHVSQIKSVIPQLKAKGYTDDQISQQLKNDVGATDSDIKSLGLSPSQLAAPVQAPAPAQAAPTPQNNPGAAAPAPAPQVSAAPPVATPPPAEEGTE
jgi:hypothetical protein